MFQKKKSFFGRLQEKIEDVILMRSGVDDEMLDELEEALITSDIGMDTAEKIIHRLKSDVKKMNIRQPEEVRGQIQTIIKALMDRGEDHRLSNRVPLILLLIGVNGSGKTTSIAKLARHLQKEEKTVLFAAADTFRAG